MTDPVNHPQHYFADNGMEAIDVIEAFFHDNYFLGNVFKYISRAGKKDSVLQDLNKAKVYLVREIERVTTRQEREAASVIQQKFNKLSDTQPTFQGPKFLWSEDYLEPVAYDSLADVPEDVVVADTDGDYWRFEEDGTRWLSFDEGESWERSDPSLPDTEWDDWAPFTEVLDD